MLFAKEGASVVATARREGRLEELVKISKDFAGTIIPLAGDVAKEEDLQNYRCDHGYFGRIDILVNNAGILDDFTPIANLTDELWNNVIKSI